MKSSFWLYVGIFLACSGIGTAAGIVILMLFFWNDIRNIVLGVEQNDVKAHPVNSTQSSKRSKLFHNSKKQFSDDTLNEMK